jgi:hypothetical protein
MLAGEKECWGVEVEDCEGVAEGRWNWVVIVTVDGVYVD